MLHISTFSFTTENNGLTHWMCVYIYYIYTHTEITGTISSKVSLHIFKLFIMISGLFI